MSLIHDALKKVQIIKEVNVLPNYVETGKRYLHFNLPAAKIKITYIIFFFIIAVIAAWWIIKDIRLEGTISSLFTSTVSPIINGEHTLSSPLIKGENRGGMAGLSDEIPALEKARTKNLNGIEFYKQEKFSLAIDEFLAAIEIFPEYAEVYNNMGLAYKQLGDAVKAEDSYKKAMQYKPKYPEAMNNYGVLLDSIGDSNEAREYFKKAILFAPDYPDPCLNIAISFEKDKNFNEAITYYERFLSLWPAGDPLVWDVQKRILHIRTISIMR